ncbi:MAG: hydrogen gas-evolving membrane-bound hydrogenase subunit E [Candidatus Omnitrophota bacterium]|jgi:multisubunit Na+/H+ antiporter MnhB subunit
MELHILLIFMIFAAVMAIETKDLFSSIIAMGSVGFALCLAFLVLKAPDLAITQLVVELLCLIILIRATINKDLPLVIEGRWFFNTVSTLVFICVFLFFAWMALKEMPVFGEPVMAVVKKYIEEGTKQTGAANLVSAVVLDFRAYDTLAEAAVLFTAIIGIMTVLRKPGRKHKD